MRIRTIALSVVLCLPVTGFATEANHPAQQAAAEPAKPDKDNERVCRTEHVTGTMIPKRVCMTRAQQRDMQERSQTWLREAQRSPNAGGGQGEG